RNVTGVQTCALPILSSVRNHLDVLHDYYRLRKEVLNLKDLHLYDVYTNLVPDTDTKYPFETASRLVLDALKPLGDAYINDLKQRSEERRVGKDSRAR